MDPVAKVPTKWEFRLDEGFDDSEWADISIGQAWEAQGYAGYNGGLGTGPKLRWMQKKASRCI